MTIRIISNIRGLFLEKESHSFNLETLTLWQGHGLRLLSFYDDNFIEIEGTGILDSELNKYAFGWAVVGIEELDKDVDRNKIVGLMQSQAYLVATYLQDVLQFLWFVKDNSICIDSTRSHVPQLKAIAHMRNYWINSTSDGQQNDTVFTDSELSSTLEIWSKYRSLNERVINAVDAEFIKLEDGEPRGKVVNTNFSIRHYNDYNRISRAILFLANARVIFNIPHKIALYVPILECLFSVDNDEIKHKVAERVAHYIGDTKDRKLEIYNDVSTAYNIRSRFMHGDEIKDGRREISNENLQEVSKKIDALLREVLRKVIMEDANIFLRPTEDVRSKDGKNIEEEGLRTFLKKLIFQ